MRLTVRFFGVEVFHFDTDYDAGEVACDFVSSPAGFVSTPSLPIREQGVDYE